MAGGALRFEIGLARFRIADDYAGRSLAARVSAGDPKAVNERCNIGYLLRVESELRHAAIDSPVLNNGRE
jgi:hypothetical protein